MDLSKLKEFYKSYSSLVVPLVILLAGVIVLVPAELMSRSLRQNVEARSLRMGRNIQSLQVWPREQWIEEKKRQDVYQQDANQIEFLAKQSTQRQFLSYDVFPEPKYDSPFIFDDFGKMFRGALDQLIAALNAGDCPTTAELDQFKRGAEAKRSLSGGWREVDAAIEDNLCREKAEKVTVYANPEDLDGYEFPYSYIQAKSREEAVRNCWYAQLAYWIIRDVIDTAHVLNAESVNVFTSPVKRILSVSFPLIIEKGKGRYATRRSAKDGKDVLPSYVLSQKDGFTTAYTRRASNADTDIVHFRVEVVVSTGAVLSFMQELCSAKQHQFKGWDESQSTQVFKHNQITVLQYAVDSVKRDGSAHELYRYGEDAVVKLSLVCEYIFDAKAYDQVKPKAVKDEVAAVLEEIKRENTRRQPRGGYRVKTGTATKTKSAP
jgi:hypothetical protein